MSPNLLSFLEGQLSADVVAGLASYLQVPAVQAGTAALAGQQALLVALTQRATSPHGARDLLAIIDAAGEEQLDSLARHLTSRSNLAAVAHSGSPLAASLLDGNETAVANWLAAAVGLGQDSARVLLALLTPLVLHGIRRHLTASGRAINPSTLADLFGTQAAPLLANIPVGLATALAVPSVSELVRDTRASSSSNGSRATGLEFLKWVLPLIAVVTLMVYVMGGRASNGDATEGKAAAPSPSPLSGLDADAPDAPTTAEAAPEIPPVAQTSLGAMVDRPLPKQRPIRVPENGLESRLLAFISDSTRTIDSTTVFTFDRLEFDTATATLRPSSNAQLDAMAAIMKAYPQVSVKISGYTDNIGDDVTNLRLSSARAEATKAALVARGIAAGRISTEGFGSRYPVASNATEQGRQRNRRIDVRVTRK